MVLQRWDPVSELRRMEDTMNRLWRGVYSPNEAEIESWAVPLDVIQEGDTTLVAASMPGVKPEDIEVSIEDDVMTIKGKTKEEEERKEGNYLLRERRAGSFYRSIRLPETVDTTKAESKYDNGVLTVSFPKHEAKKAKKLEIKVK